MIVLCLCHSRCCGNMLKCVDVVVFSFTRFSGNTYKCGLFVVVGSLCGNILKRDLRVVFCNSVW